MSLKNTAAKPAVEKVTETLEGEEGHASGGEMYFNVLWRKYTTKKWVLQTNTMKPYIPPPYTKCRACVRVA